MDIGEVCPVTMGACEDLYVIETGMYDVTGYGGVYVLDAERPAIVETGIGANYEAIIEALATLNIPPSTIEIIAVTHVHLDHAGGAGFLARACENATVTVHESGAPHLVDPTRLIAGTKSAVGDQWAHYVEPVPVDSSRVESLADGDVIDLGDHSLEVIHVPGHAPHQVAFYDPAMDAMFTGDAAGIWVPDRQTIVQTSPPPNFDLDQAVADLEEIHSVDPVTLLFTHFGPMAYDRERVTGYAETLTNWVSAVASAREELPNDDAVVEYFVDRAELISVWSREKAEAEVRLNVSGVLTYLDHRVS